MLAMLLGATPGGAQAGGLTVTITDSPDPAASLDQVSYVIKVKNTASVKALDVVATIQLPPEIPQYVSCSTAPWVKMCTPGAGVPTNVITIDIGNLVASGVLNISLVLQMPDVSADTDLVLAASATSSNVTGASDQETTTVLTGSATGGTRGGLIVDITDTPDPAPTLGQVTYAITVKNDASAAASNVSVTVTLPAGGQFVKCATTPKKPCAPSSDTITVLFGTVNAHATVKISLVLAMPSVTVTSTVPLGVKANGDGVTDGNASEITTVLPATAPVVFYPSGTPGTVSCGGTLGAASFPGSDTEVRFTAGLGCASSAAALTMQASGKTINLAGFKVVGGALASNIGNAGIVVNNASNVTILGGGTAGTHGIEYFDFGVRANSGSANLHVDHLRVFRARSAAIETLADGVALSNVLVDKTVAVTNATATLPGGVGIHASGNTLIQDVVVRRSGAIGIWADGTSQVSGVVTTITGNTASMQIDQSAGIGLQLDNGPHSVKATLVAGDGINGTSTDGVVVGPTGIGIRLDSVVVKEHGGDAFVIEGTGTVISQSSAEDTVGGNGFVVSGNDAALDGNQSEVKGHGFLVSGLNATLTSNSASAGNDGFVINGDGASLSNNDAKSNGARGIVVQATLGSYSTNSAQYNGTHGFAIPANNNQFKNNVSKQNKNAGFFVGGAGNHFDTNAAELNNGIEWIIGANNVDDSGNKRNGSTFTFTSAGGNFN
jgi:uncharacterized repeat protein (TIGR01451 family)